MIQTFHEKWKERKAKQFEDKLDLILVSFEFDDLKQKAIELWLTTGIDLHVTGYEDMNGYLYTCYDNDNIPVIQNCTYRTALAIMQRSIDDAVKFPEDI